MTRENRNWLDLSLLLSFPVLGAVYGVLNRRPSVVHSLVTHLDQAIPFIKGFAVPYMGWPIFVMGTLIYFYLRDRGTYFRALLSIIFGVLICFAIYATYQTTVPRPILVGDDLFTQMLVYLYRSDQPYNAFPSIHTLTSTILAVAIRRSPIANNLNRTVIEGLATTIILSTMFVKQHVLLDVLSAILLGEIVYGLVHRLVIWPKEKNKLWINLWTKQGALSLTTKKKLLNWSRSI